MDVVRAASLIVTTLLLGLVSGFFYTYSISVMVSLRGTDDRTFVDMMQKINRDVQNPRFFMTFIGSLLFGILTVILYIGQPFAVFLPVLLALVFYVGCFGVTVTRNVPMNVRLDKYGPPDRIADIAAVRKEFEEPWVRLNGIRAWFATLGFGAAIWALIAHFSA
ncbi:hypothetical protein ALI144C_50505 [Actinosynnema sp. ALI-1.44]|uniref:anthrone oxygenase family protein n=1 Tax=Actinosynnema sp. ALI-1.44 TaxID=1933779 RepID=UPI00097C6578|nr:DUF1772 domain-containing protein [Actinosynnema sp. ALI-1.44]ONI70835.1 hypothetical protein ALI144C_50505 [Actinosynnema sp. ALI-1.44]